MKMEMKMKVRPHFVGDWCFPLLLFLLTPFSLNGMGTAAHNLFDGMLMNGRSAMVEAIGLPKERWRILQDLNVGIYHALQTIVACCMLHNLCQIAREPEPELWKEPDENGGITAAEGDGQREVIVLLWGELGESLRQALADDMHQKLSSR